MTDTGTTPDAQDHTQGAGGENAAEILIGGEHEPETGAPDGAPETYADFAMPEGGLNTTLDLTNIFEIIVQPGTIVRT